MINVNKIRLLLTDKKISIRDISREIGISEAGFHKIMRNKSTNVETLIKISRFLNTPIQYLIDDDKEIIINEDAPVYNSKPCTDQERIQELKELIRSKDTIIDLLNEKINTYSKLREKE